MSSFAPAPLGWTPSRLSRQSWLLTLFASVFVVTFARVGPDWPAQEFRSGIARNIGLRAWNDAWYSGHALPGYSVLYPPLAALLGAGLTGLLAATACAWAGSRLATSASRRVINRRCAIAANVAMAVTVLCNLLIGQVPFLLGAAFGLFAILALRADRPRWTVVFAAVCSLASPLSGFFLLLAAVGFWREKGWRTALPLLAAASGSIIAALVGGTEGTFPFDVYSRIGLLAFTALALVLLPRSMRGLRGFVLANGVAAAALASFPNAIGGNLVRLAALISAPLALWVLAVDESPPWRLRRLRIGLFAVSVVSAVVWQAGPAISAVARSAGDRSSSAGYYSGLLGFLATQDATTGRLEIPFTREHWEAAYVAPHFPLARGWERQLDVQYDEVLYHPLTAASYRAWLGSSAVDLVAIPDAPLDYGGVAERTLLARPPAYLHVVYRDPHWTVYRVANATPMLTGADAKLVKLGASSFTVRFARPGTAVIRLHASSLWRPDSTTSCIDTSNDGWLHLRDARAGTITVKAEVTLSALLRLTPSACDDD
jgi:hypothetical protein